MLHAISANHLLAASRHKLLAVPTFEVTRRPSQSWVTAKRTHDTKRDETAGAEFEGNPSPSSFV